MPEPPVVLVTLHEGQVQKIWMSSPACSTVNLIVAHMNRQSEYELHPEMPIVRMSKEVRKSLLRLLQEEQEEREEKEQGGEKSEVKGNGKEELIVKVHAHEIVIENQF